MSARFSRRSFLLVASKTALATIPFAARIVIASETAPKYGGLTPNDKFYVTTYGTTPIVNAASWRLRIKGLVTNPLDLSYADIRAMPPINETLTLECIGNPPDGSSIGNAKWTGIKLKPLFDRARLKSRAVWCRMRAADGYYTGLPADELLRDENFLPYLMNGAPLPPEHGFPLRIFIPGKYGMKQPKWITEIEFLDHKAPGYWETRGWTNSAWRKVNSGFFAPHVEGGMMAMFEHQPRVTAPVEIWGWALAGPSGVRRVQVSSDDGATWRDAQIVRNDSPYIWTVWKFRFSPPTPGDYMLRIKATDGKGLAQPPTDPQTGSGMGGQARIALQVVKG
jgi:DMSO/TMAO reductase YedYZ molybdopterin-dependent catalytic subunit